MQVSFVPVEYIDIVWPQVRAYLDGAAKYTYGRFTVEDIKVGIETKPQQLWIAFEDDDNVLGAVVTEVLTYPRMKALVMHFTGGVELAKWKPDMLKVLQRFAKDNDCAVIESYGREGWGKVFQNDGFKSRFMFYELPAEK